MTEKQIDDAKRYLGYFVDAYKLGKESEFYPLFESKILSEKISKFIVKSLRFMCVDFDYTLRKGNVYHNLKVRFK
jgi:hypothetical protein